MSRWNVRQTWAQVNKMQFIILTLIASLIIGIAVLIELIKVPDPNVRDLMPCHYVNSIDISDGERQTNGSFKFNNRIFSKNLYAEVDFMLSYDPNGKPFYETVRLYYRGCICNITRCLFLCHTCDGGKNCKAELSNEAAQHELDNEFGYHFHYMIGKPCFYEKSIKIERNEFIVINGTFIYKGGSLDPKSFFVTYDIVSKETLYFLCKTMDDEIERRNDFHIFETTVLPYFLFGSAIFLIFTTIIYIWLPELRNLHGKCLLGYFLGLAIGFSIMGWFFIVGNEPIEQNICLAAGYIMYSAYNVAFSWLDVICFDLWWNFRQTSGFVISEKKRFIIYNIHVWVSSIICIIIPFLLNINQSKDKTNALDIRYQQCLNKTDFIRDFMGVPMLIMCILNIVFFILAFIKIRKVRVEIKKLTSKDEYRKQQKKLRKDKDNVAIFLRLFIVMGVGWVTEAISYFINPKGFFLLDVWNSSIGVWIFVCMVLKPRVFRLMKRRWRETISTSSSTGEPAKSSSAMTGETAASTKF